MALTLRCRMRLAIDNIEVRAITATPQKAIVICSASSFRRFRAGHRALDDADAQAAGLLARMQLTRAAVPAWLRERHAEGIIRIGALGLGDVTVRIFERGSIGRARCCDCPRSMADRRGPANGRCLSRSHQSRTQYKLNANIRHHSWRGGKVDLSGSLTTFGTDSDFLLNLRSQGTFQARSVDLVADYPMQAVSGSYGLTISRLQIKLTSLQAASRRALSRARNYATRWQAAVGAGLRETRDAPQRSDSSSAS